VLWLFTEILFTLHKLRYELSNMEVLLYINVRGEKS